MKNKIEKVNTHSILQLLWCLLCSYRQLLQGSVLFSSQFIVLQILIVYSLYSNSLQTKVHNYFHNSWYVMLWLVHNKNNVSDESMWKYCYSNHNKPCHQLCFKSLALLFFHTIYWLVLFLFIALSLFYERINILLPLLICKPLQKNNT